MQRKTFLKTVAGLSGLAALALWAGPAAAQQTYPNKPLRLVVTFPPGGAPDILARLFAEKAQLGQPVVVDNKPGAGGNIGAEMVAKAPADGHTLVMCTVGTVGTHAINGALYSKMPCDRVRDFALKTPGLEPWISTPEELSVYQAKEMTQWAKVVKDSGAKAD